MSLSRDLVRLIRRRTVSEDDLRQAALFVLDTVACALGALQTEPARILAVVAPPWESGMFRRAFYLGGLSHILELDDLHRTSVTHPGCVVIPAAWAVADAHDLRGRAFLRAVLAGYEASTRVGMAVGKAHYKVWHSTGTCGPFGSAMAAAELLGLTEEQTVWALGNAGTQSCGLWEFLSSGAMSKHLHTARAAESGLLAARLAREGFTGPDTILEGEKGLFRGLCSDPSPEAVTASPDGPWQLTRSSIKPWPCCRHTHPAIDAALALRGELGRAEIDQVEVATYGAALDVCDRPDPNDPYSAKFSLQHCVATALRDGCIEQQSFGDDGRRRAADLRPRIALRVSPKLDAAYPEAWGAEIRVRTADSRTFSALRPACKGDPENPVTEAELVGKAMSLCASGGVDAASAQALATAIAGLVDDIPARRLSLLDYARPR
jgi:2-methylcitrate dehydratase PrpD